MEEKKTKKKWFGKVATFISVFAITVVGAYLLTPDKVKTINLNDGSSPSNYGDELDESYLDRFVNHVKDSADVASEDEISGLRASFEGFELTWSHDDFGNAKNTIGLDGSILFKMANINDIQFTVDAKATYNNKTIDFAVGYVSQTVYLALKDLRLKSSYENTDELFSEIYNLFFNAANTQGLGMTVDIDNYLNDLIDNLDFNELLNSFKSDKQSMAFGFKEEVDEANDLVYLNINLDITEKLIRNVIDEETDEEIEEEYEETTHNLISIVVDKTTLGLKKLDLNNKDENGVAQGITFGDFNIKGALNCEAVPGLIVYGFDSENYVGYQQGKTFTEIINFKSWLKDLLNLLQSRKLGFELTADVTLDGNANNEASKLVGVKAGVNLDFSSLFDLQGKEIGVKEEIIEEEEDETPTISPNGMAKLFSADNESEEEKQSLLDKILDNVKLGVDLSLTGQEKDNQGNYVEYANLGINYANQAAYIALNEDGDNAVMRAKATTETLNNIISKIPTMMESLGSGVNDKINLLFSFLTDSELVSAIKEGKYDGILDVLKTITNTENTIELVLDLSSIGLGDNAEVSLTLAAKSSEEVTPSKVLDIEGSGIEIGEANLSLSLKTHDFSNTSIAKAESLDAAGKYDNLSYLPTIFDQVSGILDSKKAGFDVGGKVYKNNSLMLDITGWGQFDYGTKYGYGRLDLKQYSEGSFKYNHLIKIDVDNQAQELKDRNVKFTYGPNEGIKGKFTIQTVTDIFDIISTFIKDVQDTQDERFTKFIDPIIELLGISYIGDAIKSRDYIKFAKSEVIKEIKETSSDTIKIVIGGSIFSLDEDIVLNLKLKGSGDDREIDQITLPSLNYKDFNINSLSITLKDYDTNVDTPVPTSATFMDFSQIKVLLDFGINTTKLNYYHLTADVDVNALAIFNISFQLDFHVQVTGSETKVYGAISDVPYVVLVSNDALTDVSSEFVFEPSHDASNNDIGGYFHILRTEVHKGIFSRKTEKYYYKSDSKNFLDADNSYTNLIYYLVVDMLNIKSSLAKKIVDASNDSGSNSDPDYEKAFTSEGFTYSHTSSLDTWKIGLNLKDLTGVSALGNLSLTINGSNASNNKGYLNSLNASIKLVSVVTINAAITLKDIDPSAAGWTSSINSKYNNVVNCYNNLSSSKKTTFNNNYFNKPLSDYKL